MQTLSLFPDLLFLGLIAPTLLRISVGIIGFLAGKQIYKTSYRWFSILYFLTSIFLIIGMYTQAFALIGILIVIFENYVNKKLGTLSGEKNILQFIVGIILLSLLFTGPGFLAFDLPL